MRSFYGAGIVLAVCAMAGCIHPYKLEIRQGNVVTKEMVDTLKPGMTKSQVRFVLGTPLITDPFHPERWDYVYVYKKNVSAPATIHRLTVIFNGDVMARTEGDLAEPTLNASATPRSNASEDQKNKPDDSSLSKTARAR